jgi:hypothetical protein
MDERELLKQWTIPEPSGTLDARVYKAFRESARRRSYLWIPAAAAAVVVIAALWPSHPVEVEMDEEVYSSAAGVTIETGLDVSGFRPIPNAKLQPVREEKP